MLIFVYNADSGLINSLMDVGHRLLSPQTYPCNLCALTYSVSGIRREWFRFLRSLNTPFEFVHKDELRKRYGIEGVMLPAVFKRDGKKINLWIDAKALNSCQNLDALIQLVTDKV